MELTQILPSTGSGHTFQLHTFSQLSNW